jgi:hypothetical protein
LSDKCHGAAVDKFADAVYSDALYPPASALAEFFILTATNLEFLT